MDKRIREGIEACRPGVDNLLDSELAALPELAEAARAVQSDPAARLLSERVQKWDEAISSSIAEVPVPADLAQRILAQVVTADTAPSPPLLSGAVAAAVQDQPRVEDTTEVLRPSLWQRRHWAGASLSAIAAAAAVVAVGYWLQSDSDLPLDQLAGRWQSELTKQWQPAAGAPSNFPVPAAIRVPPARFQRIAWLTPTPVVAYELVQGNAKAVLYVAEMNRAGLPSTPPSSPSSPPTGTTGQAVGYWQSGKLVYVLVAPNVGSYRAFVRPTSAPLAFVRPPRPHRAADLLRVNSGATRKIA